ncbi:TetR/AcrR family transcriptional regulator [uncultured Tateyamaria sp.]|uniref:TetR/AcrR family transcriptional regulator n=1 Tax=uncultured Tateyamaria sp. TaxID=455651 RepID=UPI0026350182|nr:TetR/AcrR family transcriptional regulator [uncultured Tateyamaria sp.]
MTKADDPRLLATRSIALDAALEILRTEGVLAVTHASISTKTGVSRSTLYRHWPQIDQLRTDAFKRAASPPVIAPKTNGPLHADLTWLLGILMSALNDTPWGQIAPQIISGAATNNETKSLINEFMHERMSYVREVFDAAEQRGELAIDAPIEQLIDTAIAVPYFRHLIAGLPLDHEWLESHVDMICRLAEKPGEAS